MSEILEDSKRIGVLNSRLDEPVKSLMQEILDIHPDALLVNPPDGCAEEDVTEELVGRYNPDSYGLIFYDSDPDEMGRFCRVFLKKAIESGALIREIEGRRKYLRDSMNKGDE